MDSFGTHLLYDRDRFFNVKIGEIVVAKAPAVLKTTLGSCVAVILYDRLKKIGSMIHVMFPDSKGAKTVTPGKYADLGIPMILRETLKEGANKKNLEVFLVGGNFLSNYGSERQISIDVGSSNLEAVRKALKKESLSFKECDVQKSTGTTAIFDVNTGELKVKFLEKIGRDKNSTQLDYEKTGVINNNIFSEIVGSNLANSIKSINKKYKVTETNQSNDFDSVISVNIYGQVKGKLVLYINKKFAYSMFTYGIIKSEPTDDTDFTGVLKMTAEKILRPLAKKFTELFSENDLRFKYTDPSIFTMNQNLSFTSSYPENFDLLFYISDLNKKGCIKLCLTIGKLKS